MLGPDGTKRYLGKWCKRVQPDRSIASSMAMQGSSTTANDLIAVGADGRGGKIKVLRSLNQSPLVRFLPHPLYMSIRNMSYLNYICFDILRVLLVSRVVDGSI